MASTDLNTRKMNDARNLLKSGDMLAVVYADDAYRGEKHKRADWSDMVHYGASQTFAHMDAEEYTLTVYAYTDKRTTLTTVVAVILRVYDGEYDTLGADMVYSDMLYKMYHQPNGKTLAIVEDALFGTRMYRLRPIEYKMFAETERKLILL